jgi:hypothetical protein
MDADEPPGIEAGFEIAEREVDDVVAATRYGERQLVLREKV